MKANGRAPGMDGCPIDHEDMQKLWAMHGPVAQEIRGLLDPLAQGVSERIQQRIAGKEFVDPGDDPKDLRYFPALSYGSEFTLPPTFFGEVSWRGAADVDLTVPDTDEGKQNLIDDHFVRSKGIARSFKRNIPFIRSSRWWTAGPEDAGLMWQSLYEAQAKGGINPQKWKAYTQFAADQFRQGYYDLEGFNKWRANNITKTFTNQVVTRLLGSVATGRHESFLTVANRASAPNSQSNIDQQAGYILGPIGEYGADFARRHLRSTGTVVNSLQDRPTKKHARQLARGHEATIDSYFTRAKDAPGYNSSYGSVLVRATQEGVISADAVGSFLTAEIVEGYDTGDDLYIDAIDAGLIEQFTKAVPMGIVRPFNLEGVYIPGLVQRGKGRRKVELNRDILAELKQAKRQQTAEALIYWKEIWAAKENGVGVDGLIQPSMLGLFCPAAFVHGALTTALAAMAAVHKQQNNI